MKKLLMALAAALAVLFLVPAAHAQGWTLNGVLTDAGNPPNGTVQPTQSSTASASASYTVMKQ